MAIDQHGIFFVQVADNYPDYPECETCHHLDRWEDPHPYGEGVAHESLCECMNNDPDDCPVANRIADELKEEEQDDE